MPNQTDKFVSVIIPCRNEQKFIGACLDSLLAQDYPKDKMEILVVDGMSEDGTRETVKKYSEKYPFIKLVDNPKKHTPFALNIGVKTARGDVIAVTGAHSMLNKPEILMRIDAHASYKNNYISKSVEYLKKYDADNVGGIMKTLPRSNKVITRAIALALSSFFGVGNSIFRTGANEPRVVDTVFGGCYRREVFDKVGLFNENLVRSQDMELNLRLKKAGGKTMLTPDIVSYYYPKDNLKDFFTHNFQDGIWAIYPLKFTKTPLRFRHYVPLLFVLTLPLSVWPYIPASLFFSAKIALREKDWRLFFALPLAFPARHFGYGLGSILGLIKLI